MSRYQITEREREREREREEEEEEEEYNNKRTGFPPKPMSSQELEQFPPKPVNKSRVYLKLKPA